MGAPQPNSRNKRPPIHCSHEYLGAQHQLCAYVRAGVSAAVEVLLLQVMVRLNPVIDFLLQPAPTSKEILPAKQLWNCVSGLSTPRIRSLMKIEY